MSATHPAPRRRGLLDLTLTTLLLYVMYANTPCGALPVWLLRTAQGRPTPNLLATFRGHETAADLDIPRDASAPRSAGEISEAIVEEAKRSHLSPVLLAALLQTWGGACDDRAPCRIKAPPFLPRDDLTEDFVTPHGFAQALHTQRTRFDNHMELAIEAMFVHPTRVQGAYAQAVAAGVSRPEDLESHARFYSAHVRRGELQHVIQLLAYVRLHSLIWPIDPKLRISSPFGDRVHPVLGQRRFHNGTDVAAAVGEPVWSAQSGVVRRRGDDSVSGKFVQIDHGFEIETTFCHLSEILVARHEEVVPRKRVGSVGATGRVTGPHLHYILRVGGQPVDPQDFGDVPRRASP